MILLKNKLSLFSTAFLITIATVGAAPDANQPVSWLLASADALLSSGDKNGALEHFDLIIKKDPTNYLTFFKRGVVYLALGHSSKASEDFDTVLVLKPGFEAALVQRAKLKARHGDWDAAKRDYSQAGTTKHVTFIREVEEAAIAAKQARIAGDNQDWETCVNKAGTAILVAGSVLELRHLRANCRIQQGDLHEAIGDLTHVAQLDPSSIEPHLKIANLLYFSLKDYDRATAQLRKCLHSDPDSKPCSKLLRKIKNYEKAIEKARVLRSKRQFNSANKILVGTSDDQGIIDDVKNDTTELLKIGYLNKNCTEALMGDLQEMVCDDFIEMTKSEKARPFCESAFRHNPHSLPGIIFKATTLISEDLFEEAISMLEKAKEEIKAAENDRRIASKLKEAHDLLRRSKTKDYYKVLGVSRDSSEKEIKKAHRKLILKFHPDKYRGELSPVEIQKKVSAINEAKEVLTNPELREQFDNGDYPNSQEHQYNTYQQGNPFQGGFGGPQFVFRQGGGGGNPFGNGFKFHF